jgi:NAD(P)-dependent dehydrogenase (short-subunit alcohol dehydrogenase family)
MAEPRHVVVTGAAAGIGLAIARQLAGQGWAVGLIDQSPGVEAAADDIARSTGAPVAWALADLADAAQIPSGAGHACRPRWARPLGLVNNAGIASHIAPVVRMQADRWARELAVNLTAPMLLSHALLPGMVAAGWGRIVHISSIAGRTGLLHQAGYSATKAGLLGLMRATTLEHARHGITCNAVLPGMVATVPVQGLPPAIRDDALGLIPARRFGQPEEVAALVAFLASDAAGYITAPRSTSAAAPTWARSCWAASARWPRDGCRLARADQPQAPARRPSHSCRAMLLSDRPCAPGR